MTTWKRTISNRKVILLQWAKATATAFKSHYSSNNQNCSVSITRWIFERLDETQETFICSCCVRSKAWKSWIHFWSLIFSRECCLVWMVRCILFASFLRVRLVWTIEFSLVRCCLFRSKTIIHMALRISVTQVFLSASPYTPCASQPTSLPLTV